MRKIELSELERKKMAEAGAKSIKGANTMDKLLHRAEEWHKWKLLRHKIKRMVDPVMDQEDVDIAFAICALLQREVKILLAEEVKKDAEMDALNRRLVDEIHDLLHG